MMVTLTAFDSFRLVAGEPFEHRDARFEPCELRRNHLRRRRWDTSAVAQPLREALRSAGGRHGFGFEPPPIARVSMAAGPCSVYSFAFSF